jgi:DNA-binding LytR/AlgR family response regulator
MNAPSLRCLVVDDEPGAHLVLKNYIGRVERLELASQCYSALEAVNFLHKHSVDILFLDINMPEMTGLEMLHTLAEPPKVILCTAYSEYALESYEFGVSDYLIKPIPFPRFLKAVNRILAEKQALAADSATAVPERNFVFVSVENEQVRLDFDQIRYAQSWGNYVRIYTANKVLLAAMTTQELESVLPATSFLRVHKSYIVALAHVGKAGAGRLQVGAAEIPVGTTFRQKVAERVRGL